MLTNLEDKSSLGPNMAVALVTTLYGSVMQNWLFVPMAGKLTYHNNMEAKAREMIIEGFCQSGRRQSAHSRTEDAYVSLTERSSRY